MTASRRVQILSVITTIKEAWLKNPELRLGQLLTNAVGPNETYQYEGRDHPVCDMFYIEDDFMGDTVKRFYDGKPE